MPRLTRVFSGTSGLNTKVDPSRINFNFKTGISELAAAVNIVIDDTGRPSRRKGFTATARTESWKNLFGCGSYAIGTTGDALCAIEPNMAYTALRNVHSDAQMSYAMDTDGISDIVFYCNGYEKGIIKNKASQGWPLITPIGVTTIKEFSEAPVGHLLEVYNSRMFIAVNNFLFYSEPNTYHAYRLSANYFGFPNRIKMVEAVSGGFWVSDSDSVYFFGGIIAPSLQEMPVQTKKCSSPAIEGTAVKIPADRIGDGGMQGQAVVFATKEGVVAGLGDGTLLSLTEKKINFPGGLTGSAFYRGGKITVCID